MSLSFRITITFARIAWRCWRLEGHARRHRAIADHRDHAMVALPLRGHAMPIAAEIDVEEWAVPNVS
jgi:hypothetical protein